MSHPFFNTLKYAKLLKEHGFHEHEIRGLMAAQILTLQSTLRQVATRADLKQYATRIDLMNVKHALENHVLTVEKRLDAKIDGVEKRLDTKIDALDKKIDTRMNDMKSFILKNDIFLVLTMLSLNIGLFTLIQ